MRIIKALLLLLFLVPTLAAAEPNPESSFLRIQRDQSREPVALQTVIAKYVPASGAKGVEIDLVAVVHIGEKAYYERRAEERQPARHAPAGHEILPAAGTSA